MDIYNNLPIELQNKIKYFVLEHPVAKIIKDEIQRLRCDEYYTFRDKQNKIFCKIDGRDHFYNEYFRMFKKSRSIVVYGGCDEYEYEDSEDSESSDEYLNDVFHRMFFVSSSTSDDDE